jgi:transposase
MHKTRTSWPVPTRVAYIVAFEKLRRESSRYSAREFCRVAEISYSTFSRWWAAWRRHDKKGLQDRSRRPRRRPTALPGYVLNVIRGAHLKFGLGVKRLHVYLRQAGLISCSLSSVYRVLRRAGALVPRPRKPKPHWQRYSKALPGERRRWAPRGLFHWPGFDSFRRHR